MKYLRVWVDDGLYELIQKAADKDERSIQHVLKKALQRVFKSTKRTTETKALAATNVPADSFEKVWETYPIKKGKQAAGRAFLKIKPNQYNDFSKAVKNYVAECKERRTSSQYVKWMQGFINSGIWEDYINPDPGKDFSKEPQNKPIAEILREREAKKQGKSKNG